MLSYAATVTVPAPLTALMSAVAVDAAPASLLAAMAADAASPHGAAAAASAAYSSTTRSFRFVQAVPVAPYLIALAAGELASRELGPRSRVWSEPSMVSAGEHEFADTEAFVAAAEAVVGPYVWGRYDLLLLPPSFPYGGMENPCLTFVTPTLLAGDRSLANVVAHEVAHSWSGNLVTNARWGDFWLNEGLTVFLERKILQRLQGDATWAFHASGGWRSLRDEVARLGATQPFTCLAVDLSGGVDPDDAFSRIPYEKGFAFLVHLERLAGGAQPFEAFLRDAYLPRFAYGAVTTAEFRDAYTLAFPAASASIDWETWLHAPGMPPVDVSASYDTPLRDAADAAAMAWHTRDVLATGTPASPDGWPQAQAWASSEQLVAFLERLSELRAMTPLALPALKALDAAYALSAARNAEVRAAWLRLRVAAGDADCLPAVRTFLTEQGRMKYLRPLYRQLRRSRVPALRTAAADIFAQARAGYHPIAAKMVAQDLEQQA
jgi:leukotriene-A4 hydrolase